MSEVGGRIIVDWQFDVSWSWDDSQSIIWYSQAFDSNGEGLSPASAQSGSSATQASENDLEIDSWQIVDMFGHELSDEFSDKSTNKVNQVKLNINNGISEDIWHRSAVFWERAGSCPGAQPSIHCRVYLG